MTKYKERLVSFVVPFYNEEECVEEFYHRICKTVEHIGLDFEMICIDDHSYDSTFSILKKLHDADPRVKIVSFSRNFGHQIAIMAGLHYTSGDCIVVMDGDLQDPPEIVIKMIEKWNEGFDVVYGVRRRRKEKWIKRVCYKVFYRILQKVSSINIPLDAGDFCLMSKRVVFVMGELNEGSPFMRGLRAWVGFKQIGLEYDRSPREVGQSKYSFSDLFNLAFDGILSFSIIPLKIATVTGLIVSFFSIAYAIIIAINRMLIAFKIISSTNLIPGWASLVCSITFLIGLQFIFLGVLGEYIGRIFIQAKGRSLYIIQEKIGFKDDK